MSYAEKEKSEFAKTLHYAVQADHWTIGLVRDFGPTGATFCGVALRDKDGAILWRKDTPWYVKGDAGRANTKHALSPGRSSPISKAAISFTSAF